MTLWLLRPVEGLPKGNPWDPWCDKAFGFVIRSQTAERARKLAAKKAGDEAVDYSAETWKEARDDSHNPWLDPKFSTCTELLVDGLTEIVMRDFAAA